MAIVGLVFVTLAIVLALSGHHIGAWTIVIGAYLVLNSVLMSLWMRRRRRAQNRANSGTGAGDRTER
jgi:O-antigen/teichoic acid export membrane protein